MRPTSSAPHELTGVVLRSRPYVELVLVAPQRRLPNVLVDTGFSGSLALPVGSLASWSWRRSPVVASNELADGRIVDALSDEVEVSFLGVNRTVRAIEIGNQAIIGMGLLMGTALTIGTDKISIRSRGSPARRRTH